MTMVVMTVWIRLDQDADEAHGKNEGVYSEGGVPHVENNGL